MRPWSPTGAAHAVKTSMLPDAMLLDQAGGMPRAAAALRNTANAVEQEAAAFTDDKQREVELTPLATRMNTRLEECVMQMETDDPF